MAKQKLKKPANEARRRSAAPSDGGEEEEYDDHDMELQPVEIKREPKDQIKGLTEAELNETFTKYLNGADPNISTSRVAFNYPEAQYVKDPAIDQLKIHFQMEGELIHYHDEQARTQTERAAQVEAKESEEGEGEEGEAPTKAAMIKNQFNFSERATQTFNNPMRAKETCTEPPPTCNFVDQVSQHVIFDAYLSDIERMIVDKQTAENKKSAKKKADLEDEAVITTTSHKLSEEEEDSIFESPEFSRAAKLMERMVHTNSEAEDFQYFKYYEDKNESKREDGRGSFMPLWRFQYDGVAGASKSITSICWNPTYTDLFAVGYGSYDFLKQGAGMICCFTLKNTSHPEYVFETERGVMSVDFNREHPSLLCCGMYDGSVAVYDMRSADKKPIFASDSPQSKHTDPVWQVYWGKEDPKNNIINFYSISSDGRVINWALAKTALAKEELVTLNLFSNRDKLELDDDTDSAILGLAGGSAFDFNQNDDHLFVVGTEEGAIQLYNKQYNTVFQRSFNGHHMAIYSVKWNKFHPGVFLSCSADWTVKLWEVKTRKPIMIFDLNTSVGDVAWSPFSSTVFATITTDGRVRVYDLNVNKHEPIGEYRVQSRGPNKPKLTNICFNPVEPIICVGDDKGTVSILKLSANLRKMSASAIEEINQEDEIAKLDKVMIMPDSEEGEDIHTLLEAAAEGNTDIGGSPNTVAVSS